MSEDIKSRDQVRSPNNAFPFKTKDTIEHEKLQAKLHAEAVDRRDTEVFILKKQMQREFFLELLRFFLSSIIPHLIVAGICYVLDISMTAKLLSFTIYMLFVLQTKIFFLGVEMKAKQKEQYDSLYGLLLRAQENMS